MPTKTTRKVKRGSDKRMVGFWLFYGLDDDLIEWWEGLAPWQGSEIIRTLLRRYALDKPVVDNESVFLSVEAMRAEVQQGLQDLAEQMKHIQVVSIGQAEADLISDEEAQRRERNMKATRW